MKVASLALRCIDALKDVDREDYTLAIIYLDLETKLEVGFNNFPQPIDNTFSKGGDCMLLGFNARHVLSWVNNRGWRK